MGKFRIIPSIYLYNGNVVDKETKEIVGDGDAVELATFYNNRGADELLVFDLSSSDSEHDANIGTMIKIQDAVDIQMIVGGNVKRLEDVKKYIYTGAKKAILDMSKDTNIEIVKEASERFGSDKIAVMLNKDYDFSKIKQLKYDGVSLIIADSCANECIGLGIKILAFNCNFTFNDMVEFGKQDKVYGISDNSFAGDFDFLNFKAQLKEEGVNTIVFESAMSFDQFKKNSDGMIPVVVQDYKTDKVLMVAYMNEEAFNLTIKTGKMTYFSRSRNEIWVKGVTSGHFQYVKELSMDCDLDTMLAKVYQVGVPCHTGADTCFFNTLVKKEYDESNPMRVFEDVYNVILDRKKNPKEGSYTNYLFDKGIDKILKKVGEEATEIVIAAKNPDPQEVKYEISDFLYHVMVLMAEKGVSWKEITKELSRR
ncbi:bifunctional phosphoribosyl-AMP cyclohydrolase/phosphoribosyl-ATP diphosphatase HisIE [Eubacterium ventriosum]|uniref:bifunctional phosphoribosyl-AMP cyclohydrolase/phosphoribosyl-ATP diphosphatase HisIE n=1 Tax=Eubacterium ventriosum TaxID=39496 RepID=UPI001C00E7E9|nr:bifunctional phosphoribosyl-AMP cyclohydrolase/phosphoribosyl-ATP diphosphatase HisIE [Eubacterium ventriosum]MBT9698425.1 bifunctional phosphoribosyl-AMP cyclohydrolase/phosphoribosyl-ATP diphosphatase HisIE [Eubacterium ventriosum]